MRFVAIPTHASICIDRLVTHRHHHRETRWSPAPRFAKRESGEDAESVDELCTVTPSRFDPQALMPGLKVIKSEHDYGAALARASARMQTTPGTAEADELDLLVTLIEAYEAMHYPIDPSHPIDAMKFRMEQAKRSEHD